MCMLFLLFCTLVSCILSLVLYDGCSAIQLSYCQVGLLISDWL